MTTEAVDLPPDAEYVVVGKDGHLTLRGQRVRYWSAIGKLYIGAKVDPKKDSPEERRKKVEASRKATDALLERFEDLGFNSFRFWDSFLTDDYVAGDGSQADGADYFLAKAQEKGFKVWTAGLNRTGSATPEDVNIIDDPETAEAWKAAVAASTDGKVSLRQTPAYFWDLRLRELRMRNLRKIATHLNKHSGLRWCDDPVFAVWELSNEEWWMRRMLGGSWQKLPAFFKNELVAQWNDWLKAKYGTDGKLKDAWKELLPGESLEKKTVLFAPMTGASDPALSMNDSNEQARASLQGLPQQLTRADFAPARGSDVIAFLLEMQLAQKKREAEMIKSLGKSTRLCPLIYDTGIGYEIQSQYLHQQADAVAHDAYVNGWGPAFQEPDLATAKSEQQKMLRTLDKERIRANTGTWVNWLLKPPGISQGVPWLEQNRVEGKPYLVYETQIQQPGKYRADFPLRIAALAAIQDWDWICWHYFSPGDDVATAERPFDKPLDVTVGKHPQGYHYTYDEIQNAMMRAAAYFFRENIYKSAPKPTKFTYGRKSLYDPNSMDYAGSYGERGMDMLQTTYQYGVRIAIDPTREDDAVEGPVVSFADRNTHNPYTPTEEIVFDWKKGFLKMDAPAGAAFTGLLAKYGPEVKFENGITLRDVTIRNPPGIFDPMSDDEKYIAFACYSTDGKPLRDTRSASISLVSTSFNSGFKIEGENFTQSTKTAGGLPVLTARVGAEIASPSLEGMSYTFRDWHFQEIGSGKIEGGTLRIPDDKPVFFVELKR